MQENEQNPIIGKTLSVFQEIWNFELYNSGGNVVVLNQLIIAIAIIFFGVAINKRLSKTIGRQLKRFGKLDPNTTYVLQKVSSYLLLAIIVLIALPIAGIPITIFTVLGGAVAIGVGFGAQNLFNNLISGFIIMMEKPIRIGDIIEIGSSQGKVADIGNRCVRVRRVDGVDVLVPNSHFLEQPVVNWTLFDSDLRGSLSVGVAYGSDTQKVRELIAQAADEHPQIHTARAPIILFEDFGDNSLSFTLIFWATINLPMDLRIVTSDLRYRIDELFRKAEISISFPQRDVHLDTLKPLEIRLTKSEPPNHT